MDMYRMYIICANAQVSYPVLLKELQEAELLDLDKLRMHYHSKRHPFPLD